MKTALTLLIALLLLGCSSPVAPDPEPAQDHFSAFWDDPMPEGWMPDGTYMYGDELRIYFAAHYAEVTFPVESPRYCGAYRWWYGFFADPSLCAWFARTWEGCGYNIPFYRDIEPPC